MARIVEEIAKYFRVCPLCGRESIAVDGALDENGKKWDENSLLACQFCAAKWRLVCKRRNTRIKAAILVEPGKTRREEDIVGEPVEPFVWGSMAETRQKENLKRENLHALEDKGEASASKEIIPDADVESPDADSRSVSERRTKAPTNNWAKFWGFLLQLLGLLAVIGAFVVSAPLFDRPGYAWMPLLLGGVLSGALIIAIGNMLTLQVGIADSLYRIEVELEEAKEAIEKEIS
jgi:hypothetical protein